MIHERIWINAIDQWWYTTEMSQSDIPYRRDDQECVWRPYLPNRTSDYFPTCSQGNGKAHPWRLVYDFRSCPYCSNRIRVEEA